MHLKSTSRNSTSDQEGIALVISLLALVVVAGIGLLMFTRTLNEIRHSGDDARIVQTLMLARGGANVGSGVMLTDAMAALYDIVIDTSKPGRWSYGRDPVSGVHSSTPDALEVARDLQGVASRLQASVDSLVCNVDPLGNVGGSNVSLRIYFTDTACDGAGLPPGVSLPDGRFVNGPARIEGIDIGIQEYALPYVMVSEARLGDYQRNIVVQGEYVFSVGEAPFSHYAYFTNRESDDGGQIYFTDRTLIDGPVHTNGNFAFYKNPWFGGAVTSAGCRFYSNRTTYRSECENRPTTRSSGGYFYSSRLTSDTSMRPSSTRPNVNGHAPEFAAGVSWRAQYVPLPTNSHSQQTVALGTGRDDQGITFNGDLDSLTLFAGDANGNQPRLVSGSWTPAATHQYVTATQTGVIGTRTVIERRSRTQGRFGGWGSWSRWSEVSSCTPGTFGNTQYQCRERQEDVIGTVTTRYRFNEDNLLERFNESTGQWQAESKPFNGVIYVNGAVERLRGPDRASGYSGDGTRTPPAVAAFAQMTLASPSDIRITSDIRYEQPPCVRQPRRVNGVAEPALCQNLSYQNVLGIYTSGGDVIVGNANRDASLNAPDNVHVHAVLMSSSGQIRVENYQTGRRGDFNLLGGMIQENRGIFGLVDTSGFERVYTYDPRMRLGMAPPFFPTTGLGSVQDVRFFSFGQREQLY